MEKKKNNKSLAFLIAAVLMMVFTALVAATAYALTDTTRPTILSVSPTNNQQDLPIDGRVTIVFSEAMDPATITANTVTVTQRTTPEAGSAAGEYRSLAIPGKVTYSGTTATFTPTEVLSPNQRYGNVFTVTVTSGVKDLAGNALSRNYVWSFTTGLDSFNTGASTSQSDQSAAPGSGVTTPPASTPPPVTTPVTSTTTSASAFPWLWVIVAALVLLFVGFILAVFLPTSHKKAQVVQAKRTDGRSSPFGDVHPVVDIEGIGPKYSKALQAMGIMNTKQLWEAKAVTVAHKTGAPLSTVKSWQHMAELASVKDIGPQYAELLVRSGVHTIEELKNFEPDKLLKLVRAKENSLEVNIQGNSPGYATVEHWIDEARDHRFSASSEA